jgi:alkylation response protein AidB-like acyl-CoA dehydrogenase
MTMHTMDVARQTCENYLPGLVSKLAAIPLAELESGGSPALQLFRDAGGPGLLIPKVYAGLAATPLDAVRVVRALAAHAPSMAVATTMHHFSVATLFALADSLSNSGMEWALLEGIASQNLLVSSGFAEGSSGQNILAPTMAATTTDGGYLINGSKKPCSLSRSMDLMTASVALPDPTGASTMAVLLIPAATPGITVHPFWASNILAGAESDEVRLENVFIPEQLIMRAERGADGQLDDLQTIGFIWFEMLISSCYLGMASALAEKVFQRQRSSATDLAGIGIRLETAALLLEGVARMLGDGDTSGDALARTLLARYGAQDAITDVVRMAVEALGGMAFINSSEIGYLAAACHCLSFHPPSRSRTVEALVAYFGGDALRLG